MGGCCRLHCKYAVRLLPVTVHTSIRRSRGCALEKKARVTGHWLVVFAQFVSLVVLAAQELAQVHVLP
jgi:hypothetical protein